MARASVPPHTKTAPPEVVPPPSATSASAPLRQRLRSETRTAHVALERDLNLPDAIPDLRTYGALLRRFHGFYVGLEPRLEALSGWSAYGLDLQRRAKRQRLERDLRALGSAPTPAGEHAGERPLLPEIDDLAAGFGCLYVLEGATLGGAVLQRALRERLGPPVAPALAFYDCYGSEVGAMWTGFLEALTAFEADHPQRSDEVVAAARTTFEGMRLWMSG